MELEAILQNIKAQNNATQILHLPFLNILHVIHFCFVLIIMLS